MYDGMSRTIAKTRAAASLSEAQWHQHQLTASKKASRHLYEYDQGCLSCLAQRLHFRQRLAERPGRKPAVRLVGLAGTSFKIIERVYQINIPHPKMAPAKLLNRNIRPSRVQPEDDDDFDLSEDGAEGEDAGSAADFDDESGDDGDDAPEDDEDEEEGAVDGQLEKVSFGALKQAQDALSRKRKRNEEANPENDEKLEKIRERLREIKRRKESEAEAEGKPKKKQTSKKSDKRDEDEHNEDSDSDSDSGPEEVGAKSKHAPMAQSSRYEVTRKRQVIEVPKMKARDPRFDAMQQRNAHTGNVDKAYGFLADYQADEIAQLKAALKTTKDPFQQDLLKRKIGSMENRIKAKASKEREQEVLRRHRKEERQKVESGKNPYYLKKSELKEQALVEKYKGMKGKDREKAIDKKRKKESQKEIKRMPEARRMVG
jgi:ribosomal RNA-processing protein 36